MENVMRKVPELPKPTLKKVWIGWALAILTPAIIMMLPETPIFSWDLKLFLSITLTAIVFMIFEQIPMAVIGLMLPIAYVLILKAPAAAVYKPWGMSITWMLIGGFLLANCAERTGLLRRIAFKCILMTGATYKGIIYGIGLAGILIFLLMPNDNAAVPIAALAYGICLSLNLRRGAESTGIMLAAAFAAMLPGCFLFNTGVFMLFSLGESATGPMTMGWFQWLYYNFPNALYYAALFFMIFKMFGKDATLNGKDYFEKELRDMGKLSSDEKKVLVDIAILIAFIFTNTFHKIDVLWGFAVIPFLMYLPGLKVADGEDLKKIQWPMIFFATGCLSIGSVAGVIGMGELISKSIVPIIDGQSPVFVLFVIYTGFFILNFVMTPMAILVTFTLPLAQVAMDIGMNPLAIYMTMGNASDQILLPYEVVLYLVYFSFGMMRMKDFIKFMSVKTVFNTLFMFCILVQWWRIIGILEIR